MHPTTITPALALRFWSKVNKDGPTQPAMENQCWVWVAAKCQDGYGNFSIPLPDRNPQVVGAHRASWILANGQIPRGLHVLHRCDNRACVRPDHLFLGTHAENMADRKAKGRAAPVTGEKNPFSKLTWAAVDDIRASRAAGVSVRALAVRHGVQIAAVYKVLYGMTWVGPRPNAG